MFVLPESPSLEEVGSYYDRFDAHYRALWGNHLHHGYWEETTPSTEAAKTKLLDLSARWLQLESNHSLIDIGCGYGESGRYLSARFGCSVLGLTLSEKQFEKGTELSRLSRSTQTRIERADFMSWSRNPRKADAALSLECLCHIANKGQFFKQLAQTLKPNSRAVITFLAATERGSRFFQRILISPLCQSAKFPTLAEVADIEPWVQAANLRVISSQNLTPKVQRTWMAIALKALQNTTLLKSAVPDRIPLGRAELGMSLSAVRLLCAYWLGAIQYRFLVVEAPSPS